jgi:DNA-binding transcriptional MerR regulator
MDARHTISEVAARTGCSPSALRYYENAGLIAPERTDSGYRAYDQRDIERLRFISRAEQLGLSLHEITDLVQLWEGDQCAPVAGRLRDLIDEKIGETQRRVSELIAFAADLQEVRTSLLTTEATAGPGGDDCACHAPTDAPAGVELMRKAHLVTAKPPISCTLDSGEMTQRTTDWQQLLAETTSTPTAVDGGVTVRFPADPDLAGRVAALAVAEQSCCSFFTFTVRIDHTGTTLRVTAPPDAASLVDALLGVDA